MACLVEPSRADAVMSALPRSGTTYRLQIDVNGPVAR
jgi:hypothetical protein